MTAGAEQNTEWFRVIRKQTRWRNDHLSYERVTFDVKSDRNNAWAMFKKR